MVTCVRRGRAQARAPSMRDVIIGKAVDDSESRTLPQFCTCALSAQRNVVVTRLDIALAGERCDV